MATTANYGWTTPDDTDLVKDGASAIRTLGSAIDTTTKANADLVGLVHIVTVDVSASASESINNVFTSDYDNYFATFKGTHSATDTALHLRLRASGSDNSTASSYVTQVLRATGTSTLPSRTTDSFGLSFFAVNSLVSAGSINIFNPFLATATAWTANNLSTNVGAQIYLHYGSHNQTVSYDGFTIFPPSGTITGQISVFGYAKA